MCGLYWLREPGEAEQDLPFRRPSLRVKGGQHTAGGGGGGEKKQHVSHKRPKEVKRHVRCIEDLLLVKRLMDAFNEGSVVAIRALIESEISPTCEIHLLPLGIYLTGCGECIELMIALLDIFPNSYFCTSDTTIDDEGQVTTRFEFIGSKLFPFQVRGSVIPAAAPKTECEGSSMDDPDEPAAAVGHHLKRVKSTQVPTIDPSSPLFTLCMAASHATQSVNSSSSSSASSSSSLSTLTTPYSLSTGTIEIGTGWGVGSEDATSGARDSGEGVGRSELVRGKKPTAAAAAAVVMVDHENPLYSSQRLLQLRPKEDHIAGVIVISLSQDGHVIKVVTSWH